MHGKNGKLKKNQEMIAVGKNHVFSVKRLSGKREGSGVFGEFVAFVSGIGY